MHPSIRAIEEPEVELGGLEAQLRRYTSALDMIGQGICLFDGNQRLVFSNQRYTQIYGLGPSYSLSGMTLAEIAQLRVGASGDRATTSDEQALACQGHPPGAEPEGWTTKLATGKTISVRRRVLPDDGWIEEHEDISEHVEALDELARTQGSLQAMRAEHARSYERVAHLAFHDKLTGLPNRIALGEHLAPTFERAAASGESFAVLRIDLDHFAQINEFFDRSIGDVLLCEVAKRLRATAEGAFVARTGGDEFILVAPGTPPVAAASLADRIQENVAGDLDIEGQRLRLTLSIGVAVYPMDGTDAAKLLENANSALRRAKAEGRGCYRFFEAGMDRRQRERTALQRELRSVLPAGELALHYQPQAEINGTIFGFEALLRWHHPTRGLVMPGEFIGLAEESGLISDIGEWVLREACREAASWKAPLQIAVNVSPVQFRFPDLADLVRSVLEETGLEPRRLELEITESIFIDNTASVLSMLHRLRAMGVKIAMDDFGKGYSSLSSLQTFPFDKIKIDREFIANLGPNENSAAIVRAVIDLGSHLKVPVIAEGVETREQLAILADEGCTEVQGYLIGYPLTIEHYSDIICPPRSTTRLICHEGGASKRSLELARGYRL